MITVGAVIIRLAAAIAPCLASEPPIALIATGRVLIASFVI